MSDLRLKFIDADGSDVSFEASDSLITIGRHSNNSLVIADGRLSREHLRLEREGLSNAQRKSYRADSANVRNQQASGSSQP